MEVWREIEGFEGIYDVSNHGRVRRHYGAWNNKPYVKVLKPWPKGPKGHLAVGLALGRGRERSVRLVHRLVLAAFVGSCPDGMEVRHLDGNPGNNTVENLAYGTHSENEMDKVLHGTHRNAAKTHCKHGHEFTPENTRPQFGGKGRACKACAASGKLARARAKRASGYCSPCSVSLHKRCGGHCACPNEHRGAA